MKMKKLMYLFIFIIGILILGVSFLYLNDKGIKKSNNIIAYNDSDYSVIFDANYGELRGFNPPYFTELREGVYGLSDNQYTSQPDFVFLSQRNGHMLLYWSLDPNCLSNDLEAGEKFDTSGHRVYYACYEQTSFDNNGIRYVQNDALVSGENVSCGDEVHVNQCYKKYYYNSGRDYGYDEFCDFDQVKSANSNDFRTASGTVYRMKLSNTPVQNCKKNVTAYFYEDSVSGSTVIDGDGLECGSTSFYDYGVCSANAKEGEKVSVPDTRKLISDDRKFIGWAADDDGNNVNCSGKLVTSDFVLTEDVKYYACYEEVEACENSNKVSNGKGSYNVNVCYNVNDNLSISPVSADYDEILTCASGYKLDEISQTNIISDTCTKNTKGGTCQKTYNLNCTSSERPKISAQSAMVDESGYGTIVFSGSSKSGIRGWYASSYYEKPTKNTAWINDPRDSYTVSSQPGSVFLWVIDNEGLISYAAMASVIDRVNTDTTVKSLEIKTEDGVSLNPEVYSYGAINEQSITSSDYVRLSNKIVDDSKILASGFNPFDTAYKVTTSSSKIAVYATLTSSDASYVAGYEPRTVDLNYGVNTILIKIQNKKGKVRTYTIIVTREDDRDATNLLKSLTVSEGSLDFDPYKNDYIVSVGKNKKTVSVNAELSSINSRFVDGFGPRKIELNNDSTTAIIKVGSETGSLRAYTITFVKNGKETTDKNEALLSSLSLSKAYIAFDKNVYEYNTTVDYEIDSIDIYALAENGGDSVTIYKTFNGVSDLKESKNIPLNVGSNDITILVANKDGKTRKYSINILRKENGLEISSDTKLSMLDVDGYNIEFDPNVYDYEIKIKREKTLVIAATPMSNRAEVFIRGNDNLTAFSIVKVKVIAEDGQFKEYTINILKDTFNKKIEIFGLIGGLIIIVCGIIIIRVKKKRKSINDYYAE